MTITTKRVTPEDLVKSRQRFGRVVRKMYPNWPDVRVAINANKLYQEWRKVNRNR